MKSRSELTFLAYPITLILSLMLSFAHNAYVHRQAVFTEAAWDGRIPLMRLMLLAGADVNSPACPTRHCLNPIVAAALGGHDDAVRFLVDRGANINARTNYGLTALMASAFRGDTQTVKLLLAKGADVNARNDEDTALKIAKERGQIETVRILTQAGEAKDP